MNTYFLVVCLLIPLCSSLPPLNILYNDLAVTLVQPYPYQLILSAPNVNDQNQQWNYTDDGVIVSIAQPGIVFDVTAGLSYDFTTVGAYFRWYPSAINQQWTIYPNASIGSQLATGFFLYPVSYDNPTSDSLVVSYTSPSVSSIVRAAITQPWSCESSGDPHVYAFPFGRTDLYTPGIQAPGDYIMAKFGTNTRVSQSQQYCGLGPNAVYCTSKVAVENGNHVVIVSFDTVFVDGVQVTIVNTLTISNGFNITRISAANYVVNVPNGYITVKGLSYNNQTVENIFIVVLSGPEPTGGICTGFTGPNAPLSRTCRSTPITVPRFVASWKIMTYCDNPFIYTNSAAWKAANPTAFNSTNGIITTTDPVLYASALSSCAPLLSGSLVTACGFYSTPGPYYQACLNDVIATGVSALAAAIVNGYAAQCQFLAGPTTSIALPTSGGNSIAYGPGISAGLTAAIPATFTIAAKDALRRAITVGGDLFNVTVSGAASPPCNVVDSGNGLYTAVYTPPISGSYVISVLFNNVDAIANNPFTVYVSVVAPTDPTQSTASGVGLVSNVTTAVKTTFVVQAKSSTGANRLSGGDTISVTGTGLFNVKSKKDNGDGTYTVQYEQDQDGSFTIMVKLNMIQIKNSPFTVLSST